LATLGYTFSTLHLSKGPLSTRATRVHCLGTTPYALRKNHHASRRAMQNPLLVKDYCESCAIMVAHIRKTLTQEPNMSTQDNHNSLENLINVGTLALASEYRSHIDILGVRPFDLAAFLHLLFASMTVLGGRGDNSYFNLRYRSFQPEYTLFQHTRWIGSRTLLCAIS